VSERREERGGRSTVLTSGRRGRVLRAALLLSSLVPLSSSLLSCGPAEPNTDIRLWTDSFAIRVSSNPMPPRALERVRYKVLVRDKKSGEPIDRGEGRIFATNRDRKSVANGLEKGPEVGTYYTNIFFVTAGDWAMGIQFRRDSTQRLQRTSDWMQEVRAATGPGQ
jgi:hypothetical protein